MTTKICNKCETNKPIEEFVRSKQTKDGYKGYCKKCHANDRRNWNRQYPEKLREQRLKRQYGIDQGDYESLLVAQGGKCAVCGINDSGQKGSWSIDHCHKTGIVRGLLCNNCNNGLGRFKDNPDLMQKAIKYLEETSCQTIMAL